MLGMQIEIEANLPRSQHDEAEDKQLPDIACRMLFSVALMRTCYASQNSLGGAQSSK